MKIATLLGTALMLSMPLTAQESQGVFRSTDGALVHVDRRGTGEPVVLLAGGPGLTPAYLEPVCVHLARTAQCVLVHQRGTGRSVVPADRLAAEITLRRFVTDLETVRVGLNQDRLTLVGHSWGGMLAMAYAAAFPDRTKALILIASGGPTLDYMSWYGKNSEARVNDEDRRITAYWEDQRKKGADSIPVAAGLVAAGMSSTFHDRSKVRDLAASLGENPFSSPVFDQMMRDLRATHYDLRPQLKMFRGPVLLVQGRPDPIATADTLRATFSSARLEVELIDRAGHFPWLERPDVLFQAIDSFLRSLQ
jgi:proline iminopeptidase